MPNSRRWQQSGARRGWAVHEDLQQEAWLRVLQGRRPPSVKWPLARSQQRGQTGSGVSTKLGESSKERSPSHHNARSPGLRPFVDTNIKKSEAGDRVQKLQQALNILGDTEVARSIEARRDSSPGPVDKQVKDCEAFLSRARAHLEELEQKPSADAEERLVILKMQQDCAPPPPPDTNAEVQRLQDLVSHLQAQVRGGDPDMPCGPVAKRPCRSAQGRVPVLAELSAVFGHDALVNGDNGQVLELTSLQSEGAERLVEWTGGSVHEDECKVRSPWFLSWGGVEPRPPVDQVASNGKTFGSSRGQLFRVGVPGV